MKDMLGREGVIASGEALELLLKNLAERRTKVRVAGLDDALGMVCAQDITAPEDIPAFSRSTVDGYAVRSADTYGATESMPAYMNSGKEIFMGEPADFVLEAHSAAKIPTGGMLPRGADSVVMYEHVQIADSTVIEVMKPVAPSENVILAGEDLKKTEIFVSKGRRLRPADIAACASAGITAIQVFERPVVSILSTGDEIIAPEDAPSIGKIRDSNSYLIAGMVSENGAAPRRMGIVMDDYIAIRAAIEKAIQVSDVIALSGGTSVGTKDMIAKIIDDIGSPGVLFHGVSLKPGKPMIGGVINGIPILGFPGHPAAVSVCLEIFMLPVLNYLSGLIERCGSKLKGAVSARLSRNISSSQGREEHIRVVIEEREDGLWAVPLLGKSGLIRTLVNADGIIKVPVNLNGIEKGETVEVILL